MALVAATVVPAHADDCARDADRLRAHLVEAQVNARRWNLGWAIGFGAAAVGQAGLAYAEVNPLGTFDPAARDTMYVGAIKATLAFGTRMLMPIGVDVPPLDGDRCAEREALRRELATIATKERRTFWLTHLGGMVLHVAAGAFLWYRHGIGTAALSIAISYPVGLASAYTLPRASWRLWRTERATWTVTVVPHERQPLLGIAGTF